MGIELYKKYVGETAEELEKNLIRILLSSYYLDLEDEHRDRNICLPESYSSVKEAAETIHYHFQFEPTSPELYKTTIKRVKEELSFELHESFGHNIAECVYNGLEKYLDNHDLLGAKELISKKSPKWHKKFRELLQAEKELIGIKNERLQQICDVHIGELKVISAFKRLSNSTLCEKKDEIYRLVNELSHL